MEEMKKKFPSLPPNYVSLQQLQERRLREQQKKQKEKEEEERRIEDQRQRDEEEKLKKKEEEERKLQKFGKTLEIKRKASIDGSNRSYHQRFKEKNRRVKEEIDLDSKKQESKIVVDVALEIPNPEQKLEESMKKKKKKRKHKKPLPTETLNADRKELAPLEIDRQKVIPVSQSENSEGKNELAPSEIDREKVMIPVVLSENSEGKKKMHSRFRPKSKKLPQRETGGVSLDQTVECAGRIGGLTLVDDLKKLEIDGEIGVNENRSTAKMNHGRLELRGGSRRLGWQLPPRNSNLVWVKKEENNNENSSVSHHSGGRRGGGSVKASQPFGYHCGGSFKASHYSDGRHYDSKAEAIILGFQHYLVTLGITVIIPSTIVPLMGGGNVEKAQVIQTILFVTGLNTLLQSLLGTRLPAVIGGSFTFTIPTVSIVLASRYSSIMDPHQRFLQTMQGIQGALISASLFQIIVGFLGFWRNVIWFLSPLSAVPLVTLAGLGLYQFGFPQLAKCIEIGLPQLILLVLISQYLSRLIIVRRSIFDRFAVLFSVAIVWVYAHILTVGGAYNNKSPNTQISCRTDRAGLLTAAPWIRVPYPFQWGAPTFNAGEAFAMMAASFASLIESTGTFIAVSRYGSATPIPPSVLSRGVGWQGIGILLNGMFGTVTGSAASVENAGLLALTRVGSRRVIQISAGFMLFFSVLGKFGALFASIPLPIVAALYCVLFAYVASAGLSLLQFCNLNSFRTKFILGLSFFLGFSVPEYFNESTIFTGRGPVHTGSTSFNNIVSVIFLSHATVAAMVAFFLDCTLHRGDSAIRRDRGSHWWEKFRYFKTDTRSEEFYSLPYRLNKYFPSI